MAASDMLGDIGVGGGDGTGLEPGQGVLKAAGMEALHLGQGLEPGGDFGVAFFAGHPGELGIHVRVLVGFAGHCGFQVGEGITQGQARGRIAGLGGQEHEVLEGVARFAVGAVFEQPGHFRQAFLFGDLGHPGVASVGLAFAREGSF
jgi:hypothetical protein